MPPISKTGQASVTGHGAGQSLSGINTVAKVVTRLITSLRTMSSLGMTTLNTDSISKTGRRFVETVISSFTLS